MLRRIARAYATPARRAPPHTRTCAWRRRRQHTLHVYIHRRRVRFRDPGPRACPSSRVQRRGRLVRRVCGRVSRDSAVRREMRRSCDRDRERTRRHVHRGQRFSARYARTSRVDRRCVVPTADTTIIVSRCLECCCQTGQLDCASVSACLPLPSARRPQSARSDPAGATMPAYTLECSLERESIRTFRSMLMCLKQFGTDLFFEANERTVTLRTLNTAQSAFIVCTLQSAFFAKYTVRA